MKKKKTVQVITGERGQGMTYSTLAVGFDIPLSSRDCYKRLNEKIQKELEKARKKQREIIRYGFE